MSVIVYKASLAICGLYALEGNPHLAAICVIIATLQYTRCIRTCCVSIARPISLLAFNHGGIARGVGINRVAFWLVLSAGAAALIVKLVRR